LKYEHEELVSIVQVTGSKVQETFRLLERVKKHFKGFYKKCAKKKPKKHYPEIL